MYNFEYQGKFQLPHKDMNLSRQDYEIIQIFLNCLQLTSQIRFEGKVLSSIYRTADITNNSDAYIAKILVENGLRASRRAFPDEFLRYIDKALLKEDRVLYVKLDEKISEIVRFWRNNSDFFSHCTECYVDMQNEKEKIVLNG